MKKTISTILVCVLLMGAIFSLSSCEVAGFVFGTYANTDEVTLPLFGTTTTTVTYEFSGKDVTITTAIKNGNNSNTSTTEGTYEIGENEEGEKIISITTPTDDGSKTKDYSFNSGKDDGGAYIEIGGVRYYSVK